MTEARSPHPVKVLTWNGGLHTRWHGAEASWVHQHKDGTTWEWVNPITERLIQSTEQGSPELDVERFDWDALATFIDKHEVIVGICRCGHWDKWAPLTFGAHIATEARLASDSTLEQP
jgi:hypothetical protein